MEPNVRRAPARARIVHSPIRLERGIVGRGAVNTATPGTRLRR